MAITPGSPPFYAHKKESLYRPTGYDFPHKLPSPHVRMTMPDPGPRCPRLDKGMGNFCDTHREREGAYECAHCWKCGVKVYEVPSGAE